jgi:hypothetical protein
MHSFAKIIFASIAALVSFASVAEEMPLGVFELHWVCAPQQQGCERIEAIHSAGGSGPLFWVEKTAFFTTNQASTWQKCERFGDPNLCLQFGKEDMERLSGFATPANRRHTANLVFNGRVLASIGFIGPSKGPLYIGGGLGNAMSTVDVADFLQGASDR